MKMMLAIASLLFTAYVAIQSYLVAATGVANQIPQLEGDGGGGMLLALFCACGCLLAYVKPRMTWIAFVLAAITATITGLLYEDNVMLLWSIGPLLILVVHFLAQRAKRKHLAPDTKSHISR